MSQNKALDWNGIYSSRWLSVQQGGSAQKMLVECSCGKGEIFMGSQPSGWAGTWLGVRVIHSVAIQLEKFLRLRFFLPVTAHGKRVLTHLKKKSTDCEVGSLEPIFLEKNPPCSSLSFPLRPCAQELGSN